MTKWIGQPPKKSSKGKNIFLSTENVKDLMDLVFAPDIKVVINSHGNIESAIGVTPAGNAFIVENMGMRGKDYDSIPFIDLTIEMYDKSEIETVKIVSRTTLELTVQVNIQPNPCIIFETEIKGVLSTRQVAPDQWLISCNDANVVHKEYLEKI